MNSARIRVRRSPRAPDAAATLPPNQTHRRSQHMSPRLKSLHPLCHRACRHGCALVCDERVHLQSPPGDSGPTSGRGSGSALSPRLASMRSAGCSRAPLSEPSGLADALDRSEKEAHPRERGTTSQGLLLAGIALVTAYALAIERLGFLLSSFLFLVAFMSLGAIAATS